MNDRSIHSALYSNREKEEEPLPDSEYARIFRKQDSYHGKVVQKCIQNAVYHNSIRILPDPRRSIHTPLPVEYKSIFVGDKGVGKVFIFTLSCPYAC